MALKTSVTNTEKIGTVLVTQSSLVADTADEDVTTVDSSKARKCMSLEVVNGSTSDIYFKLYDSLSPTISTEVPAFKVKVLSGATMFMGSNAGVSFSVGISVSASVVSGASANPSPYTGTVSYTIIAA